MPLLLLLLTELLAEVEVEVLLPSSTSTASLLPSETLATAKEVCKDVIEVHIAEGVAASAAAAPLLALFEALFAILIVDLTLVAVGERLVSIRNLLELGFGALWVVKVLVGVVLDGELLKRFLDLVLSRVSFHAE